TKRHQKLASKKQATPTKGRRGVPHEDGQKQQTKTTKHTIEFSNNTPGFQATLPLYFIVAVTSILVLPVFRPGP
ncbi:MAG TPA: hypothetical protein VET27_24590, partial [Mycobacterium sp.]|nr:hypothetical protein [Mycobacterium sp.]